MRVKRGTARPECPHGTVSRGVERGKRFDDTVKDNAAIMSATTTEASERINRFESFLTRYYREEVAQLAQHYPAEQRSIEVDWMDLFQFDPDLAEDLRKHPHQILSELEEALRSFDLPVDMELEKAQIRITGLADPMNVAAVRREEFIGEMIPIRGQVTKTTPVRPSADEIAYACQRCVTINRIPQEGEGRQEPHECHGCERKGPFVVSEKEMAGELHDHQQIRIQEPADEADGSKGQTIDCFVTDDLVEIVEPGDRIRGTAILQLETDGDSSVFSVSLDMNHLEPEERNFEDVDVSEFEEDILALARGEHGDPYDLLVDSIAPTHYGSEKMKLAVGLQLFGGRRKEHPDGSVDRGDSHVLLLGDPGSGKSNFIRSVKNIAPRSTYASGKGASAVGLTAAAVKESDFGEDQWSLEAGALVLADGGIACVDEIDKMDEDAVKSMHEALESQEVSVSKAGINATLRARSALLAAGNPSEGRFRDERPKGEQIDLDPALLNRFDLMFLVDDVPDEEIDRGVAEHIIRRRDEEMEPAVDPELLRVWIAYAKQECDPSLSNSDARERLIEWYQSFRQVGNKTNTPVPLTARNLEAVVRLAEASARVRLSETVAIDDVKRAIGMVERSLRDVGYDPESGNYDVDIIETGRSKSQKDRIVSVTSILREHEPIERDELIKLCVEKGMDESKVKHAIATLRDKGEVYDNPRGGGMMSV